MEVDMDLSLLGFILNSGWFRERVRSYGGEMCCWLYSSMGAHKGLCFIIPASHHASDLRILFMITAATTCFTHLTVCTGPWFKRLKDTHNRSISPLSKTPQWPSISCTVKAKVLTTADMLLASLFALSPPTSAPTLSQLLPPLRLPCCSLSTPAPGGLYTCHFFLSSVSLDIYMPPSLISFRSWLQYCLLREVLLGLYQLFQHSFPFPDRVCAPSFNCSVLLVDILISIKSFIFYFFIIGTPQAEQKHIRSGIVALFTAVSSRLRTISTTY